MTATSVLELDGLVVDYPARGIRSKPNRVVKGVSFDVREGETVGLVGESGSGKTTIGKAILGLAPVTEGSIRYRGEDISRPTRTRRRELTRDLQIVYQDPYSSLAPAMTIGDTLAEPLRGMPRRQAVARVRELLDLVDLPADASQRLPREFSGGQRQRVAIARALALDPKLIVCDEPVSALDLSTQARVLDLLLGIQARTGVSYLFISHDLSVVREMSHRVAVLWRGELVEWGDGDQVTSRPTHPYTRQLLLSSPVADPRAQRERREELRVARQKKEWITQ